MEEKKKKHNIKHTLKIGFAILFILLLLIIGLQNVHSVQMDLLFWHGEISLILLVFISGMLGILIGLMYKLIS